MKKKNRKSKNGRHINRNTGQRPSNGRPAIVGEVTPDAEARRKTESASLQGQAPPVKRDTDVVSATRSDISFVRYRQDGDGSEQQGPLISQELLEDTTSHARNSQNILIVFSIYIIITLMNAGDLELLLPESRIELPVLGIAIPLPVFAYITPLLFLCFHFSVLVMFAVHSTRVHQFIEQCRINASTSAEWIMYPLFLNYNLANRKQAVDQGEVNNRVFSREIFKKQNRRSKPLRIHGRVFRIVSLGLNCLLPITVIILTIVKFLPYQDTTITSYQKILLIIDVWLIVYYWHIITNPQEYSNESREIPSGEIGIAFVFLMFLIALNNQDNEMVVVMTMFVLIGVAWKAASVLWKHRKRTRSERRANTVVLNRMLIVGSCCALLLAFDPLLSRPEPMWEFSKSETVALTTAGSMLGIVTDGAEKSDSMGCNHQHFIEKNEDGQGVESIHKILFNELVGLFQKLAVLHSRDDTPFNIEILDTEISGYQFDEEDESVAPAEFQSDEISRRNKTRLDLRGRWLIYVNLAHSSLAHCDFSEAEMFKANLRQADLRNAVFRNTDLSHANLTGADLRGADLSGADLHWANLSGAKLDGALLGRSEKNRTRLPGANLTGASLKAATLDSVRLDSAILHNIDLRGAFIFECDFAGADALGARLEAATMFYCDLRQANFTLSNWRMAHVRKVNMNRTNLAQADVSLIAADTVALAELLYSGAESGDTAKPCVDMAALVVEDIEIDMLQDLAGEYITIPDRVGYSADSPREKFLDAVKNRIEVWEYHNYKDLGMNGKIRRFFELNCCTSAENGDSAPPESIVDKPKFLNH